MGEAKRRKAADPNYGCPKRGLVVSPPIEVEGSRLYARLSNLDPQELRFSLLLWDRLVWPSSRAIHFASGPDEEFLERAGVLRRPEYTVWGDAAQGIASGQIQAFLDLENREPGLWALAQGENSLLLKDRLLDEGKGGLIELHRAVPVPNKDVPLNEILEFKVKRNDELQLLRTEIDALFAALNAAPDKQAELANQVAQIDRACAATIKVSKEWQFPVRLTNIKASVELRPFVSLAGGIATYGLTALQGLPTSASVLAGLGGAAAATAPALKLSADCGWRGLKPRQGPYRYVSQYHNELF